MELACYREAVDRRRREHGFTDVTGAPVDDAPSNDSVEAVWATNAEDPTLGDVCSLAVVVDATDYGTADLLDDAERYRDLLARLGRRDPNRSATLLGYVVFAHPDPDDEFVATATDGFTVANRRTNLFPLVYDLDAETLLTHPVPRLKKRGLYRRQRDDAERLFAV